MITELTDEEAKWSAWSIGIHKWSDRSDLNRQLQDVMDSFKRLNEDVDQGT